MIESFRIVNAKFLEALKPDFLALPQAIKDGQSFDLEADINAFPITAPNDTSKMTKVHFMSYRIGAAVWGRNNDSITSVEQWRVFWEIFLRPFVEEDEPIIDLLEYLHELNFGLIKRLSQVVIIRDPEFTDPDTVEPFVSVSLQQTLDIEDNG